MMRHQASARTGLFALLIALTGCHDGRVQDINLYARLSRTERGPGEHPINELAKQGVVTVVTECGKTSFLNVRTGLIVDETKLHEDVFAMRDRVSYRAIAYGLEDTLQLENMLNTQAASGRYPGEQAGCIRSFAQQLQSLTDPIVEGDKLQKEIDISAFSRATKEAQDEKQRQLDSLPLPNVQSNADRDN